MVENLYHGLEKIATRLGVSKKVARTLIQEGRVRGFKLNNRSSNAPWCVIESDLCEDIKKLSSHINEEY